MIKAVIFDFDDTLCLTQKACFDLENTVLAKMGIEPMDIQIHRQTWGQSVYEAIQLRSPGVDPDKFLGIMPAVHRDFVDSGKIDIVPKENLKILERLAASGRQVMVLTSRSGVESRHLLDPTHSLADKVSHFYHRGSLSYHKPDPRAFEVIEREHDLSPGECVYVGDSLGDAVAAKGAGLTFVATLEAGLRSRQDFAGVSVDAYISSLGELENAIALL